jgi:hypothetical protein
LLSQIRGGTSLKRRESVLPSAAAEKPVDTRSSLLENIRSGIKLKAAPTGSSGPAPKKESAPSSVAEILARRVAIQGASDDEDEDDDDWD